MILIKAVVTLSRKSGITADNVQNVFWFEQTTGEVVEDPSVGLNDALSAFYCDATTTGYGVLQIMANSLEKTASEHTIATSWVDHTTGFVQSKFPTTTMSGTITATPGSDILSMPAEVSTCLTIMGPNDLPELGPGGVRPMSRQRGRLYIGPLAGFCFETHATTKECQLKDITATTILASANRLRDEVLSYNLRWVIYSRSTRTVQPVTRGWMNDEPDIQRRRGFRPTKKTSLSFV